MSENSMMDKLSYIHAWAGSVLVAPFVILHEATHMAACLLFRAKLYELFLLLEEDSHGIHVWGVWREDVGGYRDIAISLAPLIWLPVGWLAMDLSTWLSLFLLLTGVTGLGDVLHVLHYTGIATIPLPGVDWEELEEPQDDRITLLRFPGRPT